MKAAMVVAGAVLLFLALYWTKTDRWERATSEGSLRELSVWCVFLMAVSSAAVLMGVGVGA